MYVKKYLNSCFLLGFQLVVWFVGRLTKLYKLTLYMSYFWEADSHSANQEISRLLWYPKIHYHVNKGSPTTPSRSGRPCNIS